MQIWLEYQDSLYLLDLSMDYPLVCKFLVLTFQKVYSIKLPILLNKHTHIGRKGLHYEIHIA